MSNLGRVLPIETPQPAPKPSALWFGWWVAGCLVALGWLTYQQLGAQQRILVASQTLEAKVAEAARISAETNIQLGKVQELDQTTTAMGEKLRRLGAINGALKGELLRLETTVQALDSSVAGLDAQALQSNETLLKVAGQSDALLATLRRSRNTGEQVSAQLNRMLALQEAVNADLAEMNRKTALLERLMGGRQ